MNLSRRRMFVPEVVQTSAMDCGPASLKCLAEGFGIPVSYGRLREACQTDVDGTSIDTMEEVAVLRSIAHRQNSLTMQKAAAARI
jgi:ATP-binding cassette subfamily B protein